MTGIVGMTAEELKDLSIGGFTNLLCDTIATSERKRKELTEKVGRLNTEKNLLFDNLKDARVKFNSQLKAELVKCEELRLQNAQHKNTLAAYNTLKNKYEDIVGKNYPDEVLKLRIEVDRKAAALSSTLASLKTVSEKHDQLVASHDPDELKGLRQDNTSLQATCRHRLDQVNKLTANNRELVEAMATGCLQTRVILAQALQLVWVVRGN